MALSISVQKDKDPDLQVPNGPCLATCIYIPNTVRVNEYWKSRYMDWNFLVTIYGPPHQHCCLSKSKHLSVVYEVQKMYQAGCYVM